MESSAPASAGTTRDGQARPSQTHLTRVPPAILLVYPSTLFLGFLYALLSPDARLGANNTSVDQPMNYFAKKSNIFNQYFVKIGWFWTSTAFCAMLLALPGFQVRKSGLGAKRRCWQAFLRYLVATASWMITTQWAFGPPLVDRGFTATGGSCSGSFGTADNVDDPQTARIFSQAECKLTGGKWKGGRDISGHVFMLALMSAFLFLEWYGASEPVVEDAKGAKDGKVDKTERTQPVIEDSFAAWVRVVIWGMVGLSLWMLLMTAIFFHTWSEKIAGLVIAIATVFVVYFLPHDVPSLKTIIGIPGH